MRLLRLHVANFGKINDLTVDFSGGAMYLPGKMDGARQPSPDL